LISLGTDPLISVTAQLVLAHAAAALHPRGAAREGGTFGEGNGLVLKLGKYHLSVTDYFEFHQSKKSINL
jgi:hypothetical protein